MKLRYLISVLIFFSLVGCKNKTVIIENYDTNEWNKIIVNTLNECCKNKQNSDIIIKVLKNIESDKRRIFILNKVADFKALKVGDTIIYSETYNRSKYGYKGVVCINKNIFLFKRNDEDDGKLLVEKLDNDSYLYRQYNNYKKDEIFEMRECCPESTFTYFMVQMRLIIKSKTFEYSLMDLEVNDILVD